MYYIKFLVLFLFPMGLAAQTGSPAVKKTVKPPAPFLPVPNPAQLRWHKAEYIMFAHFGMKTFYPSDDHMGYGDEDPDRFNPVHFDATQWVKAARAGGFKGIVLTTKHHDGFCNWPTATTGHSVAASKWRGGKGDVVRDLASACRKGNVYFGLYVSIIDKHFEKYGSPNHKSYGDFYFDQIKELSTKYGRVDEYWFDGFNADNLKMDYPRIGKMIAQTQPAAVVYDSKMLVETIPDRCIAWPGNHGGIRPDQNYRQMIGGVMRWYPNEASIILQGNWFHNGKPSVSLKQMQDYYLTSVGYGSTPLMNISPNADGRIDEATIDTLKRFKAWVDQLHNSDPAKRGRATASGYRGRSAVYAAGRVNDGKYDTYFATDDGVTTARIEIDLGKQTKIDGFILQEYIPLGQRVEDYTIECRSGGKWVEVFSGKKIGYKRIILSGRANAKDIRFPDADAVRLKINNALACPLINNFQVISL
ncbi:alpha-L-fucosidase [Niabella drilacis]|uniref:alpha-L-fucosidase n=1 Tax=Niabella drilacis (strain DSM 25811 / CCM 8410 / CCUG 62505 / LMG 26954 / E90) TaxID=1285928 RepID=A0A1G7A6D2_NIADE|nr:alpha-L-fucosidase [Niabella drilacis]SDE10498.1 alpha-L-fucosidase [Niabella drilacis]